MTQAYQRQLPCFTAHAESSFVEQAAFLRKQEDDLRFSIINLENFLIFSRVEVAHKNEPRPRCA